MVATKPIIGSIHSQPNCRPATRPIITSTDTAASAKTCTKAAQIVIEVDVHPPTGGIIGFVVVVMHMFMVVTMPIVMVMFVLVTQQIGA